MTAGLLLLSFSNSSNAALDLISCNGCTSSGMESAAKLSQQRTGSSYVAVVNFRDGTARKYYRSLRYGDFGEPIRTATQVEFTSSEQHDLEVYQRYRETLRAYVASTPVNFFEEETAGSSGYVGKPTSHYSSRDDERYLYVGSFAVKGEPYEFLSASYFRNDAYDYYMTGISGTLLEVISSSLGTIEIPTGADYEIYIDIEFYDSADKNKLNGKVKVTVDTVNEVFQVMSAKDADNNEIPLDKSDINGSYRFNIGANSEIFLNYINLMFGSSSGSTPSCVVTSKKTVGNNHIYTFRCT